MRRNFSTKNQSVKWLMTVLEHKIDLEKLVAGLRHPQSLIRLLRPAIVLIDIKAKPANVSSRPGQLVNVSIQRPKHPALPKFLRHIYTLNPPEIPISPIAPFQRNQDLADDLALFLGDKIHALFRIPQQCRDSPAHARQVQTAMLGLPRQPRIVLGNNLSVGNSRLPDFHFERRL